MILRAQDAPVVNVAGSDRSPSKRRRAQYGMDCDDHRREVCMHLVCELKESGILLRVRARDRMCCHVSINNCPLSTWL